MGGAAIRLEGLNKQFGRGRRRVQAVRDLSLTVAPGQVYGFLGPNGAGKSTTIRMIMDLVRPSSGSIFLFDRPVVSDHAVLNTQAGALVEGARFYPFLSGRENLAVLARTGGSYDPARITTLLQQVGLTSAAARKTGGYSTGMLQRLGIAAALLHNPRLVILDEPTNGLDPGGIEEMRSFIRTLVDEQGKTVFLSSHMLGEVEQVCDRVAIINEGALIREGAVATLLADRTLFRLEVDDPQRAEPLLAARWPVEILPGALRVTVAREDVPGLLALLVEGGVAVYEARLERQSLERFFLDAVRGHNGAAV